MIGNRVINRLDVAILLDPWFSLRAAASYSGLSVRSLRGWLNHSERPLPCYRVGGKVLLRKSELDGWLTSFRQVGAQDLDAIADEMVGQIRADSNHQLAGQASQSRATKGKERGAEKRVAGRLQNRASLGAGEECAKGVSN